MVIYNIRELVGYAYPFSFTLDNICNGFDDIARTVELLVQLRENSNGDHVVKNSSLALKPRHSTKECAFL